MNFPVGTVIAKGSLPNPLVDLSEQLLEKEFNGYIVQTVHGSLIEEGLLFFRGGEIIGCIVECLGAKKSFKGHEALPYFINQTKGTGFFHIIELVRSQVDLITAFDEKLLFVSKITSKDIQKVLPATFEARFSIEKNSSFSLDTYGLAELEKK